MPPADTYEYGRSDRGLRLENNANIRSMAHDAKRQKQIAAANLAASAANVGATIVDGIATRKRLAHLNTSIESLSRDVNNQTAVIQESTRSVVNQLRENNDQQAKRDYRLWLSSTEYGKRFHYEYRPKAEKFVATVTSAQQAWDLLVMDRIGREVGQLPPLEQQCLQTGIYYPEPEDPVLPPEPEPAAKVTEVPGAGKRFLAGVLIFAVLMALIGLISFNLKNSDYLNHHIFGDYEFGHVDDFKNDVLTQENRSILEQITVRDFLDDPSVISPYLAGDVSRTIEQAKEGYESTIASDKITFASVVLLFASVPTGFISYLIAISRSKRRMSQINERNEKNHEQAVREREESVATILARNSSDIAEWERKNARKLDDIHNTMSRTLGFDTRNTDVLKQWGRFDYVSHARKIRNLLDTAHLEHPLPEEYIVIPAVEVNDRWFTTGMRSEAARLQNIIR